MKGFFIYSLKVETLLKLSYIVQIIKHFAFIYEFENALHHSYIHLFTVRIKALTFLGRANGAVASIEKSSLFCSVCVYYYIYAVHAI